jgi:DNA-binding IclR family transcriptional regulator
MTDVEPPRTGIQSVEVAARILDALARATGPVPLKSLAEAAAMAPAKAHRYLVSLARARLVEQDPATGRYAIGPLAMSLGLAALGQVDAVRVGSAALVELRDRVDETAVLAVWSDRGPTVIRFEESSHPVTINVRVGSAVPILRTALGQALAASTDSTVVTEAVEEERRRLDAETAGDWPAKHVADLLAVVRIHDLARIEGDLLPGISAMAAPLRDHTGRTVAAIGAIGRTATLDNDWNGPIAAALRAVAAEASARLGFTG